MRKTHEAVWPAAVVVVAILLVIPGGCALTDHADSDERFPEPAKYRESQRGWGFWSEIGDPVESADEVGARVGIEPLRISPGTRSRLGAVTLGDASDPKAPRWYVEFWEGLEFHQRDLGSREAALSLLDNRPQRVLGLEAPVTSDLVVRGHPGYGWNRMTPTWLETADGGSVEYFDETAGIAWVEGAMYYSLVSTDVATYERLRAWAARASVAEGQ